MFKNNRLRFLAALTTSVALFMLLPASHAKRSPGAPDIPSIAEAGLPGYDAVTWFGVLAPAGTPRAIVLQLHTHVVRAVNDAGVRKRFIDDGADPSLSAAPEAFALLIRSEVHKWAKVIKDAGIQAE